jgi:conjugal transfer/entry exclusion protein
MNSHTSLGERLEDKDARIEDLQTQIEILRELLRNTSGTTNAITPSRAAAE